MTVQELTPRHDDPLALIEQLTPQTQAMMLEYLEQPGTLGDVLAKQSPDVRTQMQAELSHFVDLRGTGPAMEMYFKQEH